MDNDSLTALKTREQLEAFMGIFYPRFSKPEGAFIGQMLYGVQAARDVKLSSVSRALGEPVGLKKTMERLSRHLAKEGMAETVCDCVMGEAAAHVGRDTLIILDPTDIQKDYAKKMPYLAKVWDGSRGCVGENLGYGGCAAVACELDRRKIVPLHLRLWSSEAPGYKSENDEIEKVIDAVSVKTGGRGVYVFDRGGDRFNLFKSFHSRGLDFIIRLVGNRGVSFRGKLRLAEDVARKCRMRYAETVEYDSSDEGVKKIEIQYGSVEVRLPDEELPPLRMVVVRGFSEKPMMLLTTLKAHGSRERLERVVHGYLSRWRVEDTIRYIKQSYRLEDMRLMDYTRLRNMTAIVLAAAYFASTWLGKSARLSLLVRHVTAVSKRMFAVPEFFYYAIADGISMLFSRHGKWTRTPRDATTEPRQMELAFT